MGSLRALHVVLTSAITLFLLSAIPAYSTHGPGTVTALAIDPLDPTTLYAGTNGGGLFKSTDGGASWSPTGLNVPVLAIDPRNPNVLYAGWHDGGVYKSVDGGASWSPINLATVPVSSIAIAPRADAADPTTVYVGTFGGVYKSVDGGASWSWSSILSYEGVSVVALVIDPLTPSTLFAGTEEITGVYEDGIMWSIVGGVFRSVDGGTSWDAVLGAQYESHGGCYCSSVLALAIAPRTDPRAPATVYAGTYAFYAGTFVSGLFMSLDGGASWTATGLTGVDIFALAIDPLTPTTLHAGTPGSGYKSLDGGATWIPTSLTGVYIFDLAIDPLTPTTLYAGTSGGGYKSLDGGATWSPTGLITWSHISTVSLSPTSVVGGSASIGTVTISAAAPAGGAVVAVFSSDTAVAMVPTSVTVPAGATSANFTISTSAVTASTTVTISAGYGGVVSSQLTVTPNTTLSSLNLSPASVTGGNASTGTVILSSPAPAGGAAVALYSGNPAIATVPANVTVAAGATSGTFTVSTSVVATSTAVWISATNGGITRWAALTVTPTATLSSVILSPTSVTAGATSTGTVTLSTAAPAVGAVVALSSSNPAVATVPASVTVPGGATSGNFTVSSVPCTSGSVTISGIYGGVTRSTELTVTLPATDTIMIQQADYFASRRELRVAAKSTGSSVRLWVYVTSTREFIGELTNLGDGKYSGQFTWPANPQNVTVWSSLCGSATSAVRMK